MKTITSSEMSCQASTRLFNYIIGNRSVAVLTFNRAPTGVLVPAPQKDAENLMEQYLAILAGGTETVSERGLSNDVRQRLLAGEIIGVTNTRGRWNSEPSTYLLPFIPSRGQEFVNKFLEIVSGQE